MMMNTFFLQAFSQLIIIILQAFVQLTLSECV